MTWIKENRFLAGFFAVLTLGVGVLGYLLFAAVSHYGDVSTNYDRQVNELSRLQHLHPFPNAENLEALSEQKKEHQAKVDELQKSLSAMKLPVAPITPEQFQDKLRAAVTDFKQKADAAAMKLPDKFYLGFARYQTEPPKVDAAPLLSSELDAMRIILDDFPKNSVAEIKKLDREELPEEKSAGAKADQKLDRGGKIGNPASIARAFDVDFVTPKGAIQVILNDLITNQRQFFIPRVIKAIDTEEKGPSKVVADVPAAPPVAAPPVAPAPGAPQPPVPSPAAPSTPIQTIVGDGMVEIVMHIEIVDFLDPAGKASAAAH